MNSSSCSLYVIGRPSVCLSVTFVRPTQAIEIFGHISTPFGTLAICLHPGKILRRSSQGNPTVGGVKHKRGSRIYRFWTEYWSKFEGRVRVTVLESCWTNFLTRTDLVQHWKDFYGRLTLQGLQTGSPAAAENVQSAQETYKGLCKWRPLWAQTVTDGIVYELLRRLFHIGNFCFWVPFFKQLLLKNCAVDFVEICTICTKKAIN